MGKSQSMLSNERQNSFLYDIIKVYREWAQVAYSCVPNILIYSGQHSKIHAYNPKVVTNHGLMGNQWNLLSKRASLF